MRTGHLEGQLGMDSALERAADWAADARRFINRHEPGDTFTADSLRYWVGDPPGHGDALGAVIRGAAKSKRIRPIGYVTSTRPDRHGATIRIWERT